MLPFFSDHDDAIIDQKERNNQQKHQSRVHHCQGYAIHIFSGKRKNKGNQRRQSDGQKIAVPVSASVPAEEEQEKEQKIETVEFNEFFDNIQRKLKDAIKDNEILEEIDNGTIMNIRELEHDLQGCKEHISNELIKKIMKDSTPNGGNYVVYEDFVKLMLNKS
jgi:hypothetical protein